LESNGPPRVFCLSGSTEVRKKGHKKEITSFHIFLPYVCLEEDPFRERTRRGARKEGPFFRTRGPEKGAQKKKMDEVQPGAGRVLKDGATEGKKRSGGGVVERSSKQEEGGD